MTTWQALAIYLMAAAAFVRLSEVRGRLARLEGPGRKRVRRPVRRRSWWA